MSELRIAGKKHRLVKFRESLQSSIDNIRKSMSILKDKLAVMRIVINYSSLGITILIFLSIALLLVGLSISLYGDKEFQKNLLSEMHGLLFEIAVLGVFIAIFSQANRIRDKRYRFQNEIFMFRTIKSPILKLKMSVDLVELSDYRIRGLNINECDFSSTDLQLVYLQEAQAYRANFAECDLIEANFERAKLEYASFSRAKCLLTNFKSAELSHVKFVETRVDNACFDHAILDGAHFVNARGLDFMQLCKAKSLKGIRFDEQQWQIIKEIALDNIINKITTSNEISDRNKDVVISNAQYLLKRARSWN